MSALKYPTTYEKEWPRDARPASDIGVSVTSAPPPMMTIHEKPTMTADQNEQNDDPSALMGPLSEFLAWLDFAGRTWVGAALLHATDYEKEGQWR